MSSDLVPRLGSALAQRRARRLDAATYVAHTALQQAGTLSAVEGHLIERVPLGERRYGAIVDTWTQMVCSMLADRTMV